ncbi:MAG: universal stress protein [Thermodesulfobacteriota bacterium]
MATKKFNGFKNIILTTDFSDASTDAFSYALSMARNYNAKLTILHVVDTSTDASGFYLPHISFKNLDKEMKSSAMAMLEKNYKRRLNAHKKYEFVVLSGNPHKEIIKYTDKTGADLVVMGTYGHSGIDRLVFGSTTERVLREAKCPVLAIHPMST